MYAKYSQEDKRFGFSETDNGGVKISTEQYINLMNGIGEGKFIVPDAEGSPIFGDNPLETEEQKWANLKLAAKAALANNDIVAIRCAKAGVKYPAEWQEYDSALREIVSSQTGDAGTAFPVRPAYPSGT